MRQLEINSFVSFTLAIILLFIGKVALNRSKTLRKYSIPEPVIGGLLAGIVISNFGRRMLPNLRWSGGKQGLALISDIALGMFLVMALMSLKLWELKGAVAFLSVVIALQVLMTVLFAMFVVFRALGKDYEGSVIAAGFTGITLGTTATAIVSMTAVTKQHGAAHRAFLLVPLVGGFFIDIINALAINFFANL